MGTSDRKPNVFSRDADSVNSRRTEVRLISLRPLSYSATRFAIAVSSGPALRLPARFL